MDIKALSKKEVSFLTKLVLFIGYLLPIKLISDITGVLVDNYFYVIPSLLFFFIILKEGIPKGFVVIYALSVFLVALVNLQITPLHLLSLVVIYYICKNIDFYKDSLLKRKYIKYFGIIGIILYSGLYFGTDSRFAWLGIGEINISGMGIFLLGSILYKTNKILGRFVLLVGVLTFSRNYILAVFSFFLLSYIMPRIGYRKANKIVKVCSFMNIAIMSCAFLFFLSIVFQQLYDQGLILEYTEGGMSRFLSLFEVSNYHRFTVNTNVIEIYKEYPYLLFKGIPIEEFSNYNAEICKLIGNDYSNDRPHNYFFSYIQIYGLYSLLVFVMMAKIFKIIVNRNNLCVFIPIMIYGVFLGMGISGYWFYISVIALIYYSENQKYECTVAQKQ